MNEVILIGDSLLGVNGVLIGINGWNLWRTSGHRKAAADAYRRADKAACEAAVAAQISYSIGTPTPVATSEPGKGAGVSEIPDLVEPIVGWRCWSVWNDGHLVSLNGVGFGVNSWEPRQARRATCSKQHEMNVFGGPRPKPTHKSPYEGCSCGFYAAKLLAKAQWPPANYAYGRVAMWGKVIEHEGGYRAEYAYPIEVILVPKSGMQHRNSMNGVISEDIEAWSDEQVESIRLRMETMYGIPVRIGSDDAMRDEWAAQYLDLPLPPQVVPLLSEASS